MCAESKNSAEGKRRKGVEERCARKGGSGLVVSNDEYNRKTQDIVVCAITSKLEEKPYSILIDSRNLSGGSLPLKSRVRADKILQVEKSLVIKAFAKLDSKTFDALVAEITKLVQPK